MSAGNEAPRLSWRQRVCTCFVLKSKSRFLLKFVWVPVRVLEIGEGWAPGSSAPGVKCAQNRALHRRSPLKERRRLRDFRCEAHFRQRDKVSRPIGTAARPMYVVRAFREDAPDFVEVGEAGIARDDAMRHQRRVQLVG